MVDNPYQASSNEEEDAQGNGVKEEHKDVGAGKAAYNVVTDTVTGLNMRGSDNKFQAKFIAVSTLLAAGIGALCALLNPRWNLPWYGGALAGAFGGLVFGVFGSGIFLMIYRAFRHLGGKHD